MAPMVSYIYNTDENTHHQFVMQSVTSSLDSYFRYPFAGRKFQLTYRRLSLLHIVQTGAGAHPASYPAGTWGSSLGGKAAGRWSWPFTSNSNFLRHLYYDPEDRGNMFLRNFTGLLQDYMVLHSTKHYSL
jgi:hypothetical protein